MSRVFLPHVVTDDSALGGSVIERSVRLNEGDNPYFYRTSTVAGDRRTFTLSIWCKFYKTEGNQDFIFMCGDSPDNQLQLSREGVTQINFEPKTGGSTDARFYTLSKFRDHKWYHFVLKIDSTQATASDRMAFYINGVQDNENTDLTATVYPSQNLEFKWGQNGISYTIGRRTHSGYEDNGDMQIADAHYVSGYAYDATAFGYFEDQTGIWKPKKYTGSYGSAGWHLDFSDKTSTTTLGYDKSGNGNHFTASGISVSSGIGNDSLLDTPTNVFPTWSRLSKNNSHTYTEGCQKVTSAANNQSGCVSTFGAPPTGKWYCEYHVQSSFLFAGVTADTYDGTGNVISSSRTNGSTVAYYNDGQKYVGGSPSSYGDSIGNGDVVGIALDMDGKKVTYYKNNTSQGAIDLVDTTNGHLICFAVGTGQALTAYINFGQQEFTYTPPTGYKKICSANIVPKDPIIIRPQKHFDTILYTGDEATSRKISGLEFQPDLVWIKPRSTTSNHCLLDSVRGVHNRILPNSSGANVNNTSTITAFNVDGFQIGNSSLLNTNGATHVAWCWKAGGNSNTFNIDGVGYATAAAAGLDEGTANPTGASVNTEAGFSIVQFEAQSSGDITLSHGLGKKPEFWMWKSVDNNIDWYNYHHKLGYNAWLNNSANNAAVTGNDAAWKAEPTSTVFTHGSGLVNQNTIIMYMWTSIPGYSKFGSYTGNGSSDGSFVHLGFRPAFVWIKCSSGTFNWMMYDSKRATENQMEKYVMTNSSNAEAGSSTDNPIDFLSNGFKLRYTNTSTNQSGGAYVYMAFAEQPGTTPFDTFPNAR